MTYIQVEISEVEERQEAPNRLFFEVEDVDYHETADEIVDRLQHLYKPKVEFELSHVRITSTPHGDGNIAELSTPANPKPSELPLPLTGTETYLPYWVVVGLPLVRITSTPHGDGNSLGSTLVSWLPAVRITSTPHGDGNIQQFCLQDSSRESELPLPLTGTETDRTPLESSPLKRVRITSTPHGDGNQGYVAIYLLRMIIIIFINFLELSKPNSLKCLYS